MRPTAKGYFSGCGGMEIGMMQAGVDIIQSLDIDKDSVDCMKSNPGYFGHNILHKDIKDITVNEQPKTDIIIGTYPCTKYSAIAASPAPSTEKKKISPSHRDPWFDSRKLPRNHNDSSSKAVFRIPWCTKQ